MGLNRKINSGIHQNIQHNFFTIPISKMFNKLSQYKNLKCYIIDHQPCPMELADLTNLEKNRKWLDNTTDTSSAYSTH